MAEDAEPQAYEQLLSELRRLRAKLDASEQAGERMQSKAEAAEARPPAVPPPLPPSPARPSLLPRFRRQHTSLLTRDRWADSLVAWSGRHERRRRHGDTAVLHQRICWRPANHALARRLRGRVSQGMPPRPPDLPWRVPAFDQSLELRPGRR